MLTQCLLPCYLIWHFILFVNPKSVNKKRFRVCQQVRFPHNTNPTLAWKSRLDWVINHNSIWAAVCPGWFWNSNFDEIPDETHPDKCPLFHLPKVVTSSFNLTGSCSRYLQTTEWREKSCQVFWGPGVLSVWLCRQTSWPVSLTLALSCRHWNPAKAAKLLLAELKDKL